MSRPTLLAIGKIVKAFGIGGEVVVFPMTDDTLRFKKLKNVFVGQTELKATDRAITAVAVEQRGVRLRLEGIEDRTAAEQLVGLLLFVDEKDAVRLQKGTFFIHQVVGLNVVDETGQPIGSVKDVLKYPAHDVYVVESNGRELMLPAVKEFIKKIDIEANVMRVKLIEGMLDESKAEEHDAD